MKAHDGENQSDYKNQTSEPAETIAKEMDLKCGQMGRIWLEIQGEKKQAWQGEQWEHNPEVRRGVACTGDDSLRDCGGSMQGTGG